VAYVVDSSLVERAREFHGHICPFLVLGLRASEIAMKRLGIEKAGEAETVGEEILAIVECNNCFADGVQVATGCTLGNNSLIYLDLGKNAVTLVRRGDWKGVRVYVDSDRLRSLYFSEDALRLFEKVVVKREGTREDQEKLRKLWTEIGLSLASTPEDLFKVEEVRVAEIERAPIFESVKCEGCGELAMATRVREVDGKRLCLGCVGECEAVVGRGIVSGFKVPLSRGGRP
jgi:formylmethanofuran dehydrogenase subunit E